MCNMVHLLRLEWQDFRRPLIFGFIIKFTRVPIDPPAVSFALVYYALRLTTYLYTGVIISPFGCLGVLNEYIEDLPHINALLRTVASQAVVIKVTTEFAAVSAVVPQPAGVPSSAAALSVSRNSQCSGGHILFEAFSQLNVVLENIESVNTFRRQNMGSAIDLRFAIGTLSKDLNWWGCEEYTYGNHQATIFQVDHKMQRACDASMHVTLYSGNEQPTSG